MATTPQLRARARLSKAVDRFIAEAAALGAVEVLAVRAQHAREQAEAVGDLERVAAAARLLIDMGERDGESRQGLTHAREEVEAVSRMLGVSGTLEAIAAGQPDPDAVRRATEAAVADLV